MSAARVVGHVHLYPSVVLNACAFGAYSYSALEYLLHTPECACVPKVCDS